jgi:hypothetical protein
MSLRSSLIKEFKQAIPPKKAYKPVDLTRFAPTPISDLDDLAQQYIMARRSFDDELAEYIFLKIWYFR